MDNSTGKETPDYKINPLDTLPSEENVSKEAGECEVFAIGEDGVDFRTVGWIRGM